MKTNLITRKAIHTDLDILLELMNEFYSEAGFVLDYEIVRSSFNELLNHAEFGSIFLMYLDSNPVGHAVITIRYAMEYGGFVGYIEDWVSPIVD